VNSYPIGVARVSEPVFDRRHASNVVRSHQRIDAGRKAGKPGTVDYMELFVHDTPARASSEVARLVGDAIEAKSDGRFSLGLAGGSTPTKSYRILGSRDVAWESVDGWLTDERWVAPDSEQSNGRMACEVLFDHVPATLHRPIWDPEAGPEAAAAAYESELSIILSGRPDLVLLGMGDDGHTASLFPGSDAIEEEDRLYVANVIDASGETRLTATFPLLHMARRTIFLAFGDSKAPAVRASFEGTTPAGRIGDGEGEVEWHIDRAAASLLS
jgi:6-phosphogluconolactonase